MRHIAKITVFALLLLLISGTAFGNPGNVQERIDETREEIDEYEQVIKLLDEDIKERLARIDELESQLKDTQRQLRQTEVEIAESQARLEEQNDAFAGRVRSAYMKGGMSYLEVLLGAENFSDLVVRVAYLARIFNQDAQIITAVKAEYAVLQEKQQAMEDQLASIEDFRYQMDAQRRNLLAQRRRMEEMLSDAKKQLQQDLAQLTPQANRQPVYGIILDNAAGARPQHGLAQASKVYEFEVEGRITRYLALFSTFPQKVGPIRSAREHSILLSMENGVRFITASASRDNLEKINEWNVKYTNALGDSRFYRDSSRRAPHNLYVNLASLGLESRSSKMTVRPAYLSRQGSAANSFSIEYSNNYRVGYRYNEQESAYQRLINGQAHRDATGQAIMARNVIVQYVPHPSDWRGRPTPDVIGSGPIDFYAQGQRFRGTWRKDNMSSPTRFYYQDGQEIELLYGQTWIQLARP
ncbi:DUF3048 domain-containing protein [Dethiobacter alkaliphilus]|uniref:DUF3048 domain-containing protein n=1 Tax=Dethiobacter alkaliphilus AHT 1 TaxID=555088 RepID=C0GIG6_DETAL|nr:DUF3048 domain-containing protein [Dethiobacter alkaliphilus]EEG76827.1 conserved hypothetical protein [Dethiobacter alkaliphilus AHT 1]